MWQSLEQLRESCALESSRKRIRALRVMRRQLAEGRPRAYLRLAKRLVQDRSNTCRWQALAVVGEYIPYAAEDVWKVVVAASRNSDDDMRDALAVLLLEHLLEFDFDKYFPRVRELIVDGDSTLLDILGRCYRFVPKRKWRHVERLLKSFRKSRDAYQ
ncbi:MAG: hypothetical protein HUU29_12160 [Planctomycetaceae bacterium]|nr:hypothetical protein [Planctomycetaceae bacterium]